ncbi:hypothetical protein DUI87_08864 [Hirundo rustica rustica]|uniref:Uncharacterized protein n=1 Tax=Hirundo rustica rustica TaxID=333673 RepID=A0A3M0KKK6_HIRRU|nr:hypothetical protein DUI87_08864 [Hirundo rustica rustica]
MIPEKASDAEGLGWAAEIIDLTGESSEPEVIVISDDESAVDMEQSQQQPHLFRASENSAEPVAKKDEEEPRKIDDDWLLLDFDPPYWSDEDSEGKEQDREQDREQNQQPPHVSSATENSAGLLARDDEEKPSDVDGPRPAGPANPPRYEGEDSEGKEQDREQDREQNQQPPHVSSATENSAGLLARDDEEKPSDVDGDWLLLDFDPPYWSDEDSEGKEQDREQDREQNQQPPHVSSATENSAGLLARDDEEKPSDVDGPRPAGPANPPRYEGEDSEGKEQDREQDREQNQQPPHVSSATENSAGLLARDDEEKPSDVDGPRPAGPANPPRYEGEDSEQMAGRHTHYSLLDAVLLRLHGEYVLTVLHIGQMRTQRVAPRRKRIIDLTSDNYITAYGQEMRYVTLYYPDNGTGANDAVLSELGSEEEDTQSSEFCNVEDNL